ncbi:MAG: type II secretion system protein GspK, partial [Reyranella sp.]|nr:type II secretion system protein GspK [Reyranella sp.]
RLLGAWGVSDVKAVALTDALLDYRDADDLRRLNGAEANDYRAKGGETELRNGDLLAATELQRVFGWRDTPELWGSDPITDHVSTQRGAAFNPNAATWRALVAMAGIDAVTAKALVVSRLQDQTADISSLLFGAGVGDPFGANSFVMPFPGPTLLVTLRSAKAPWGYRMVVTHTPGENTSPWRIGAVWRVAMALPTQAMAEIPVLPQAAALRDPNATGQLEFPF